MAELLLEIGTEELPASYVAPALAHLERSAQELLADLRLSHSAVRTDGTPRRLVLVVEGLAEVQPDKEEEVTGPKVDIAYDADGNLSKAGAGFLRGRGIDPDDAYKKDTGKGEVIAAMVKETGKPALDVLPAALEDMVRKTPFQKTMRWGDGRASFGRPVQWLLALLDDKVVPVTFADVTSSNETFGHRFHAPQAVAVKSVADHHKALVDGKVMLSFAERRQKIQEGADALAQSVGGTMLPDDELLDIVANLVERPWPLLGTFDEAFLRIPKEILVSEMREHQKYFAVVDTDGNLMPHFIVVAGSEVTDAAKVGAGNARVLRSRFEDGAFYFEEDKKTSLTDRAAQLSSVLFQRDLGTVAEKVARIETLTAAIADALDVDGDVKARALKAASLCKADLVTGVVGEFPELQGVMGRHYATIGGEDAVVAQAIEDHYAPRHSGAVLPETLEGALVALADRLDTIVSITAIGKGPTTGGDPFALRRAAIAFATIATARGMRFSVEGLVQNAVATLQGKALKTSGDALVDDVVGFMRSRLRAVLTERLQAADLPSRSDVVDAAIGAGTDDLSDLDARAHALAQLRAQDLDGFDDLAGVFKRVANILKQAREKGLVVEDGTVDAALFDDPSEGVLHEAITATQAELDDAADGDLAEGYFSTLSATAKLKAPLAEFFDNGPMVMTDDEAKRQNRLSLLLQVARMLESIADFTRIQLDAK